MTDQAIPSDAEKELKARFLSTASHDLRTPLTTIKGSSDMLGRDVGKATILIMKDMLDRGVDRVERILNDLLYVVRADMDGGPPVHIEMTDLSKVVRERFAMIMREHPNADLEIEDGNYLVYGDSEQVRQVLDHLLENADKFCSDDEVTVALDRKGKFAEVSVSDKGPGIDDDDVEKIFERFVRLERNLTRYNAGAGIGLYIARRASRAMGGDVTVESNVGRGSTFRMTIPLVPEVPADGHSPS